MLTNPNERTLVALASLRSDADWQTVMDWLRENAKTLMTGMCSTKDDVILRQQQGAAQTLVKLLELEEQAGDVVHRMRSKT